MMKLLTLIISFSIAIGWLTPAFSAEAPRTTKEDLKALLGNPDLVIIDVRYGRDWTNSDVKIQGAVREDPDDLKSWANKYSPDKTIVLYCA
jgi:rhodanese-related sulfurtransferase